MSKFKHDLGLEAQDKITKMKGILISRIEYLTGCNRYGLQPRELHENKIIDAHFFDEDQIEITGEGILAKEVTGKKKGACGSDPKSNYKTI